MNILINPNIIFSDLYENFKTVKIFEMLPTLYFLCVRVNVCVRVNMPHHINSDWRMKENRKKEWDQDRMIYIYELKHLMHKTLVITYT